MNKLITIPEGQPVYSNGFFYVKSDKPIEDNEVVYDRRDGFLRRVICVNAYTSLIVLDKNNGEAETVDRDTVYKLQHINLRNN